MVGSLQGVRLTRLMDWTNCQPPLPVKTVRQHTDQPPKPAYRPVLGRSGLPVNEQIRYYLHSYHHMSDKRYRPISFNFFGVGQGCGRARRASWPTPLGCFLMALTLSGCAGLSASPKTALGFEVPASWSGMPDLPRNTDASLLEWWGRFNDPLLTGVIEQALRNNTNVIAAQAALQQARALRNVAAAALLPVLGSGASVQQSRTDKDSSNHFQIGLDASWELDFFGARRSAVAALDATAQASSLPAWVGCRVSHRGGSGPGLP
jgi:hypothetical protein